MKKIYLLLFVCFLSLFVVSCSKNDGTSDTKEEEKQEQKETEEKKDSEGEKSDGQTENPKEDQKEEQKDEPAETDNEEKLAMKSAIAYLKDGYNVNPNSYLPTKMKYENNAVSLESVTYDFSSDVNISDINYNGYGEQWAMVLDNISQSETFFKVLTTAQNTINSAFSALESMIDSSKDNNLSFTKTGESYTLDSNFKDGVLTFNLQVAVSTINPTINMVYDSIDNVRTIDIIITENNRLKYVVSDGSYQFAICYGGTLKDVTGTRTAYFEIDANHGNIYEFITVSGKDLYSSCCDFYIDNDYLTVVGNKASGMLVTSNYICELYDIKTGALIAYEVKETISKVDYNSIWFNLNDIDGFESIKITEDTEDVDSKSDELFYLNGSESYFVPTYNTKFTIKTSRKYLIELRSRFYSVYNTETGKYEIKEEQIPMISIQEGENFASFEEDFKADNKFEASVNINTDVLNVLLAKYDELIPIFIQNKEIITSQTIKDFLK